MDVLFKAPRSDTWVEASVAVPQYTFKGAATREFGTATVSLSWDDAVLASGAIAELGGTLIKIPNELLGDWIGVQLEPLRQTDQGWEMTCHQIGILTRHRIVPNVFVPSGAPAGLIAQAALRESVTSSSTLPLTVGTMVVAPPLVEDFTAAYRTLADVLADLADQSGQEWEITEEGVINWVPSAGRLFNDVLVEGRDLAFMAREVDASPLVGRVIARGTNGATRWATAPELIGNPTAREITISVSTSSSSALQVAADRRLDLGRVPTIKYRFGLVPHFTVETILIPDPEPVELLGAGEPLLGAGAELEAMVPGLIPGGTALTLSWPTWAIREGDLLHCVVPSAGLAGETILGRVLSRTYGDAYEYPEIEVHYVPRVDAITLPVIQSTQTVHYARPETAVRTLATLVAASQEERPKDLVPDSLIVSVSGSKVEGDLPADAMSTNLPTAFNSTTGFSAAALTAGELPAARIGNNAITDAKVNDVGANKLTGDIAQARLTANLVAAFNSLAGFSATQVTAGTLPAARLPTAAAVSSLTPATATATYGATEQQMLDELFTLTDEIKARLQSLNLLP